MATRSLYGVFAGGKWAMTTNGKEAVRAARKNKGVVRRMPYPAGGGCWDSPTFKACSDVLADFREEAPDGSGA